MTEDTRYAERKRRLLAVLRAGAVHARSIASANAAEALDLIAESIDEARFPMLVCGEFKRGKSSLVGALLADRALALANVDVSTNAVTSIAFGETERIDVRTASGAVTIGRAELAAYTSEQGNPNNRRRVETIAIQTPCERLRSGLVLYDTPGVGGMNAAHAALTYSLLPVVVAAIFVADAMEPFSASELAFAAQALCHVDRVLVVLTRSDLVADPAVAIEDARQKIAPLLKVAPGDVDVVAVSNMAYFDYLETHDRDDLLDSNFAELDAVLSDIVERDRVRILMERSISRTRDIVGRLREPLQLERRACSDQSATTIAEIEATLAAKTARLEEITKNGNAWQTTLRERLQDVRIEVNGRLAIALRGLENTLQNQYLNDVALLKEPERVVDVLTRDVSLIMVQTQQGMQRDAQEIINLIEEESGLRLDVREQSAFEVILSKPVEVVELNKETLFDRAFTVVSRASSGLGTAKLASAAVIPMAVGAIGAGALAGPLMIAALGVGVVAGGRSAFVGFKKEEIARQREVMRNLCRPFIGDFSTRMQTEVARAALNFERRFSKAFEAAIAEERRVLAESRKTIDTARNSTKAEALARVGELDKMIAPLERLDAALVTIAKDAPPIARRSDPPSAKVAFAPSAPSAPSGPFAPPAAYAASATPAHTGAVDTEWPPVAPPAAKPASAPSSGSSWADG